MELVKGSKLLSLNVTKDNGVITTKQHDLEVWGTDGYKIAFKVDQLESPLVTDINEVTKYLDKRPGYVSECMCGEWCHHTTLYFTTPELMQEFANGLF